MRSTAHWALLAALVALAGAGLGALGLPSPLLFGALLAGLAFALAAPGRLELPPVAFGSAQAITGVTLGAYLDSSSLVALGDSWLAVALVSAATVALSLAASQVVARVTGLDRVTAALGLVAGGASGIVGMADELGADDRLVAFMQYARVLLVVLVTPIVVAVAFADGSGASAAGPADGPLLGRAQWWVLAPALAAAGVLAGRAVRLPVATLLGPLVLAGAVALAAPEGTLQTPPLLREAAFAVIGAQVGLRFTRDTVERLGTLVVPVVGAILALMAACFGLALALAALTTASLLDAYLATTPGGLYAVLAAGFGAGADTTFVLAVQTLRLMVMLILAPPLARRIARR